MNGRHRLIAAVSLSAVILLVLLFRTGLFAADSKTEAELRRQVEVARQAAAIAIASAEQNANALAALRRKMAEQDLATTAAKEAKRTAATDAVAALAKASEIVDVTRTLSAENAKAAERLRLADERREKRDADRDYILKVLAAIGAPAILLLLFGGLLGFLKFMVEQRTLKALVAETKTAVTDTKVDVAAVKEHTNGMMALLQKQAKTEGHADGLAEGRAENAQ